MAVSLTEGWLTVPYSGHDAARVEIGVGDQPMWFPAFLDYYGDRRVAKIRPPEGLRPGFVQLRVNGTVTHTERFTG